MADFKKIKFPSFSVSMSVYINDHPAHFRESLMSVINQTVKPSEIIIVLDGPVKSLINDIIKNCHKIYSNLVVVKLAKNMGHAISRQRGIESSSNELIALMDSDDISVPDRFEKQLTYFNNYPELDVLGGQISEFIKTQKNSVGLRNVPLLNDEIKKYLKKRCPFNQMTIMMKKSSVKKVGGYIHWYCNEDYYLWIRMLLDGSNFRNLPEILVHVRVGNEMYNRRGGIKYFLSESRLQNLMYQNKIISFPLLIHNLFIRLIIQVLTPNKLRGWFFQNFFRSR